MLIKQPPDKSKLKVIFLQNCIIRITHLSICLQGEQPSIEPLPYTEREQQFDYHECTLCNVTSITPAMRDRKYINIHYWIVSSFLRRRIHVAKLSVQQYSIAF